VKRVRVAAVIVPLRPADPLLVLEMFKPDVGPGVAVLFLSLLLGLSVPQLALITGRLVAKVDLPSSPN
jgi:hypothetical protein